MCVHYNGVTPTNAQTRVESGSFLRRPICEVTAQALRQLHPDILSVYGLHKIRHRDKGELSYNQI